jgi:hypothetical protein
MESLAREQRGVRQETQLMGQQVDRSEQSMRRLESRASGLERQTRKTRLEFSALGKVLGLLKWPVLIAGIGGAIQALGGLTAGAVALLPKILDLAGAGSAFGATMIGAGAAMGVARLATADLTKAWQGNKAALAALTPEGRSFLQTLRSMRPELESLRQVAQRGIFPGVGDLFGSLRSQAPQLRGIIAQTAGDLGGLARFGGQQLSSPGFMRDLASLADQSGRAFGAAGRSAFYLGQALEQVLLAAAPLTDWMGTMVVREAKLIEEHALVARATGSLGGMFDRTRKAIQTMGDIGHRVFDGLRGVMDAARGQSDSLWTSIDRTARRFDTWTNSVTGQTKLRRWFDQMRPVLSATAGLVGAVGKAIASLTQGHAGAQMLQALRNAVPTIAAGIGSLASTLGPAVIGAFSSVVHLFGDMAGQAGPLTLVARSIGLVAQAADALVHALGPLGPAIGSAVLSFGLLQKMGVFSAVNALRSGAGGSVAAGAVPGGVTATEALAGGALAARVAAGERVLPSGLVLPAGVTTAEEAAVGGSAGLLARGGGLLAGGARAAVGAAGRFVLPLTAFEALLGGLGTKGGVGARVQGALSSATFGLIPGPTSEAQRVANAVTSAQATVGSLSTGASIAEQRRVIAQLQARIRAASGATTGLPSDLRGAAAAQIDPQVKAGTAVLEQELRHRQAILAASVEATNRQLDATSIAHAQNLVQQFTQVFGLLKGPLGPEAAMKQSVDGAITSMRHMRPAGAQILGDSMLEWVRVQAQHNPKLWAEYGKLVGGIKNNFSDLHKHVQIVNDQILTGSQTEWKAIRDAMTTPVEQAREQVTHGFTEIEQQAIGSLQAMGYTRSQAQALVGNITAKAQGAKNINVTGAGAQHGGNFATGGRAAAGIRLPGTGTLDTVPVIGGGYGAPGEAIINRWTERGIDADLAAAGKPTVDQRIRRETTPHYAAAGRLAGGGAPSVASSHPELHAGIAAAVQAVLNRFPLMITSTTGGGHAKGSYHYLGEAADLAGPPALMNSAAAWIGQNMGGSLTEGIHNPNLSVKFGHNVPSSYWGASTWAAHANHIHLAVAGALSAMGLGGGARGPMVTAMLGALGIPHTNLGGVPGAMVTAGDTMFARGLRQKINGRLNASAATFAGVQGLGGSAAQNEALGRAMMLATGWWGPDQWPYLQMLWTKESGWNASARNPSSGAAGIPQDITGNMHGGPRGQIGWGLNYIHGRYGSPQKAWAHEVASNWYASGVDMTVTRPTVFGAGEHGPERVKISRPGGGSGVSIGRVSVNVTGGISEQRVHKLLDRRLNEFAEDVAAEIEAGAEVPTAGAIR